MPLSPIYGLEVKTATAFETLTLSPLHRLEVRAACVASELRQLTLSLFCGLKASVGRRSATGLVALLRARGESWRASSQATLSPFHGLEVGAGTSSLSNWPCRPFTG